MSALHLDTHGFVHPVALGAVHEVRDDGKPSLGHGSDRGDVQVSEDGQGEGPGNGRCGHEKDIGVYSLLKKGPSLLHAEAVLLVYYHIAQVAVDHIPGEQGVGSDQKVYVALFQLVQKDLARLALNFAVEEGNRYPGSAEKGIGHLGMLACKKLGRRHEGDLGSAADRMQGRDPGNKGFSGTYVALQEAAHALLLCHVAPDLLKDLHLVGCKFERKLLYEGGLCRMDAVGGCSPLLCGRRAAFGIELEIEDLAEGQCPAGLHQRLVGRGEMDFADGPVQRHEAVFFHQGKRNFVFEVPGDGKGGLHVAPDGLLGERAAERVHGKDSLVQKDIAGDQVVLAHGL